MKYGKILTAFMLALAMCLGLTACGGDNGGDSNDNNDSIQTPPPVIEGAAYDSAADASAYGEYYGLWEGSSGAKCDTLAVSATDGGMYFTFYKDGEIMASGCAQVIEEYDQLYFFNEHDGCAYLARGGATELAIESLGTYAISGSGSNGADEAFADIADVWYLDGEKDGLSCIVILSDGQWGLRPGRTLSPWTAASWSRIRTTRTSITPAPAPLMTSPMICTPPLKRISSGGAGKMTPTCARRTASKRALPPCVHAD